VIFAGATLFFLSDQSDALIQALCDLIGWVWRMADCIYGYKCVSKMEAGPKLWCKSPETNQHSGWGMGTRLCYVPSTLEHWCDVNAKANVLNISCVPETSQMSDGG